MISIVSEKEINKRRKGSARLLGVSMIFAVVLTVFKLPFYPLSLIIPILAEIDLRYWDMKRNMLDLVELKRQRKKLKED